MEYIPEFADERQKGWCVHCAKPIVELETNRDHVPSKSLLRKPYPTNLPVVPVCKSCNEGFSADEEYFLAFLGCLLTGSTDPERQNDRRVQAILTRSPLLRARIEEARVDSCTLSGQTRIVWKPERQLISRIVLKNARGHAYFEYGEPMLEKPTHMWFAPLESLAGAKRAEFEQVESGYVLPEVGSRMLTRVLTMQDLVEGWVIAQADVYRYAVVQRGGMMVRSVIQNYLATEVLWDD